MALASVATLIQNCSAQSTGGFRESKISGFRKLESQASSHSVTGTFMVSRITIITHVLKSTFDDQPW